MSKADQTGLRRSLSRRGLLIVLLCGLCSPLRAAEPAKAPILEKYGKYVTQISVDWELPKESIVEFFSYNCNYCYQVEDLLAKFLEKKPASLPFIPLQVSSTNNKAWWMSQEAFAAATLAGIEPRLHRQLFDRLAGGQGKLFLEKDDIRAYFAGVEGGEKAAALVDSPQVAELRAGISKKIREAGITGVPTFVINQHYRVRWGSEMTSEEFTDLLLAVAALPHEDHCECDAAIK
jgi:thiol:disulfide interchange protein DsbA